MRVGETGDADARGPSRWERDRVAGRMQRHLEAAGFEYDDGSSYRLDVSVSMSGRITYRFLEGSRIVASMEQGFDARGGARLPDQRDLADFANMVASQVLQIRPLSSAVPGRG